MSAVADASLIVATQLVFFFGGWIFLSKKLFKDYEVKYVMVQVCLLTNTNTTREDATSIDCLIITCSFLTYSPHMIIEGMIRLHAYIKSPFCSATSTSLTY